MSDTENTQPDAPEPDPTPKRTRSRLRQKDPDALVRYHVQQQGGDFIIEIPANWKVTFGAVNPGSEMGRGALHCMRVYEGEKVRAVYCDIKGFRDLSIPMGRKVQSETRNSEWRQDSEGNFKATTERQLGPSGLIVEGEFAGGPPTFDDEVKW